LSSYQAGVTCNGPPKNIVLRVGRGWEALFSEPTRIVQTLSWLISVRPQCDGAI